MVKGVSPYAQFHTELNPENNADGEVLWGDQK